MNDPQPIVQPGNDLPSAPIDSAEPIDSVEPVDGVARVDGVAPSEVFQVEDQNRMDGTAEWSSVDLNAALDAPATQREPVVRRMPAVAVGLVGSLALFGIGGTVIRTKVEHALRTRSEAALARSGVTGASVSYSGRDATVRVPAGVSAETVERLIRTAGAAPDAPHYSGPRSVAVVVDRTLSAAPTTTTVVVEPGSVTAELQADGSIVMSGVVASQEALDAVRAGALQQSPSVPLTLDITIREGGIDARTATWVGRSAGELARVGASAATVTGSTGTGGSGGGSAGGPAGGSPGALQLSGAVPTLAVRDAVNAFVRTSGLTVEGSLDIVRPVDTRPTGPSGDLFDDQTSAAAAMQVELDSILADATIQFRPDSSSITPEGRAIVEQIATVVASNPAVRLEVVGHTDTNGSADRNLALSVARADAVRDLLVENGIATSRITTLGEGGTKPLVPNDTPANRRKNRRIEIRVSDG